MALLTTDDAPVPKPSRKSPPRAPASDASVAIATTATGECTEVLDRMDRTPTDPPQLSGLTLDDRETRGMATRGARAGQLNLEGAPLRDAAHVAGLLGLPPKTVLQYARDGRLPSVRIGRHVRFIVADVEEAVASMRTGARRAA